MNKLNTILQEAVNAGDVPFIVAMVADSSGITWSGAAGDSAPGVSATEDTVFRIFSMTKGIGSLAAMILIDRGVLSLSTPVKEILPQFADVQVLDGFDDDKPRLRPPQINATVSHLATHTSGCVYGIWNTDMSKYEEVTELPNVLTGQKVSLNAPLVFDPGERWDYGTSTDWLGLVVEAVDGRSIDTFCHDEIFVPLGMSDTAFEVTDSMDQRIAVVKARDDDGYFIDFALAAPPSDPEFYGMGHALYSTAPDYMRFLRMLLNKGHLDNNRILSEASVAKMLANHIGELRVERLVTTIPSAAADVEFFPNFKKSHSLGFMRMEEDVPGMRAQGSQFWAGVCNTHFWFDPTSDLAGLVMTQSLPFVEPRFMQVYEHFEKSVYANASPPH